MLLTISSGSFRNRLGRNGATGMDLLDLPNFVSKQLGLHGLNLTASLLHRNTLEDLDKLRDRADKAGCPCLVLIEESPQSFAHVDDKKRAAAAERVRRLAVAANRLGCNALAVKIDAPNTPEALELAADEVKELMPAVERLELNLLLSPNTGLTQTTDRLTALIKRIGGFRIGSLPSFGSAAAATESGDPTEALRKLAPYAGAIQATVEGFNKKGVHKGYDLAACVQAVRSVGFLNTLAIDYVGDLSDPVPSIEMARDLLQAAIEHEDA